MIHNGAIRGMAPHVVAEQVAAEAASRWRAREGTCDDCTIVLAYLEFVDTGAKGGSRAIRNTVSIDSATRYSNRNLGPRTSQVRSSLLEPRPSMDGPQP